MTIQKIVKMGNPQLLEKSKLVTEFNTAALHALIQDLKDTMAHYQGVGIAAPQIGFNVQVILFGFDSNPRYPNELPVPETVLINPSITFLTKKEEEFWEGCLSVPGLRGAVSRPTRIQYSGYTPDGTHIEREVSGFHARVVQHECDHINGILFPHRMKDIKKLGFEDELKKLTSE